MAKISDRVATVQYMLGGRTDLTAGAPSKIAVWLQNAYIEIAMGYNFVELEDTLSTVLVQGGDIVPYDPSVRAIKALTIQQQDGSQYDLPEKDIKWIRRLSATQQGRPSVCCTMGQGIGTRNLILRQVPDANFYTLLWDVWLKPVITGNIVDTVLNVPDDWLEIIDYAAALRGHVDLLEEDRAVAKARYLYGFTNMTTGKKVPGIIQQRLTQRQANAPSQDYGLQPKGKILSYTHV